MTKNIAARNWAGSLHRWWDNTTRCNQDPGPPFPRTAIVAIGGDQGYGSATAYLSQVTGNQVASNGFFPSSAFVNPVQWIGRYDLAILGGSWDGWTTSIGRDRADLVDALQQIVYPHFRPPYVFVYNIFERAQTTLTNNPNPEYNAQVSTQSWYLRNAAGSGGSPVASWDDASAAEVNYTVAWPTQVGSTPLDQSFAATVLAPDGTHQGPAEWSADYFANRGMLRAGSYTGTVCGTIAGSSLVDSRWSFTDRMKCPNAAGFFMDNCFAAPRVAGFYDLATNATASDYLSAACGYMLRGIQHYMLRMQSQLAKGYPGRTYLNYANIGSWGFSIQNGGWSAISSAIAGTMHGGVLEHYIGLVSSLEASAGWLATKNAYSAIMDFCLAPKLPTFTVSLSVPTAGSAAWYQLARYGLTTCLMDDGYFACDSVSGYDYSTQAPWLDEFGGNPGTNIAKGWMGNRVGSRPSAAAVNGVWIAEFDHAVALCNPKGNGIQTITAAQINAAGIAGAFHFFSGTQNATLNSGAAFASVTLQDSDGVLLLKG